jgi:hypothetical protein
MFFWCVLIGTSGARTRKTALGGGPRQLCQSSVYRRRDLRRQVEALHVLWLRHPEAPVAVAFVHLLCSLVSASQYLVRGRSSLSTCLAAWSVPAITWFQDEFEKPALGAGHGEELIEKELHLGQPASDQKMRQWVLGCGLILFVFCCVDRASPHRPVRLMDSIHEVLDALRAMVDHSQHRFSILAWELRQEQSPVNQSLRSAHRAAFPIRSLHKLYGALRARSRVISRFRTCFRKRLAVSSSRAASS